MSSRVDVRVENDPDMWIAINNADSDESPDEKSYDTQSSLNQGKEQEDESDDDLSYIANYVQLQAHNKRLYSRKATLQKKIRIEEMKKRAHKTRLRKIITIWKEVPFTRHRWALLFIVATFIFFICWQSFAWGAHHNRWRDIQLFIFFRILTIIFAYVIVIYIIVSQIFWWITWYLEERFVVFYDPFIRSITLFIWSILSLCTYKYIGNDSIPTDCPAADVNATIFDQACFTFEWAFVVCLIVSICYFFRSVGEEILLTRMSVRPNSKEISLALLKEHHLHMLVKFMRKKNIIMKKHEENNPLHDLDLELNSLNEAKMMDILEQTIREEGRYADRMAQEDALRKVLQVQCMQMFKYLDTEEKGYLEEKDFVPIFPSKTHRAFLVFDVGLNGKIDAIQFTRAIDEIYFARKQIWDSYVDRKSLASLLRTFIGVIFWLAMFVVALILAQVPIDTVISPSASCLIGFSFAFRTVVSLMTESFVLTLIVRPFDVGDKIKFGYDSPSFFVYKIGLFRCTLYRTDGRFYSVPNTDLISGKIINLNRSGAFVYSYLLSVGYETPASSIVAFKEAIENYLKENSEDYDAPKSCIWLESMENLNKINIGVWVALKSIGWDQWTDAQHLKLEFFLHLQSIANRLGVTYTAVPQIVDITQLNSHSLQVSENSDQRTRKHKRRHRK